jgi:hypothetical protein
MSLTVYGAIECECQYIDRAFAIRVIGRWGENAKKTEHSAITQGARRDVPEDMAEDVRTSRLRNRKRGWRNLEADA